MIDYGHPEYRIKTYPVADGLRPDPPDEREWGIVGIPVVYPTIEEQRIAVVWMHIPEIQDKETP